MTDAMNRDPRMVVMGDILRERRAQDDKWGEQNHDDYRWLAIATEEVGEASQAMLHDEFGGDAAGMVREELVQTAAVIFAWIECSPSTRFRQDHPRRPPLRPRNSRPPSRFHSRPGWQRTPHHR